MVQPQRMQRRAAELRVEEPPQAKSEQQLATATPETFRKFTTGDLRHFVFPSLLLQNVFVRCGTIRTLLPGKIKSSFRPQQAYTLGRKRKTSVVLHLGFTVPHRDSLTAAAFWRTRQPDAITGAPVAGSLALCTLHARSGPFSVPCFLPFSTARALWKGRCENLLFSSQPFL